MRRGLGSVFAGALVAAASLLLASSASATFPARNGNLIAFDADVGNQMGVFLIRRDGTHERRLTPMSLWARTPDFAPGGGHIAFDGEPPGKGDQVEVMRVDGSHVRDLAPTDSPTWSPSGKRIAFRHGSNIAVMRADGTHIRTISHGYFDYAPTWSPNGRLIAFHTEPATGPGQIAVVRPDGTHERTLTNDASNDFSPDFAPSGKSIVFSHYVPGPAPDRIVAIHPDGTHRRVLIANGRDAAFSPNGKLILFDRFDGTYDQLFVAHANGTHVRQLTHSGFDHDDPVWQPRPAR